MAITETLGSGTGPMLFLIVACVAALLFVALVTVYLKFSWDVAKVRARLVESEIKLLECTNEKLKMQETGLQAEVGASESGLRLPPRKTTTRVVAVPPNSPPQVNVSRSSAMGETKTGTSALMVPVPPPSAAEIPAGSAKMTYDMVQEVTFRAITSLAENRSNLTEANFVQKVAGVATDPAIKALLLANLEPALFYLCSGARSPQGPELVAYRFKDQHDFSVIPYPSAGRVGQFNRWFENAASTYGVSPVLASVPAIGLIDDDGYLSVRTLGVLA